MRVLTLATWLLLNRNKSSLAAILKAVALYEDRACFQPPLSLQVSNASSICRPHTCLRIEFGAHSYYYTTVCTDVSTDTHAYIAAAFQGTRHIVMDQFQQPTCRSDTYTETHALQDVAHCVPYTISSISKAPNASAIATIIDNDAVNVQFFSATNCSVQPASVALPDKLEVGSHQCYQASRFYISINTSSYDSNSFSDDIPYASSSDNIVEPYSSIRTVQSFESTAFVGVSVAVALLGALAFVTWKRQSTNRTMQGARNTDLNDSVAMLETDDMVYLSKPRPGRTFLPQSSRASTPFRDRLTTQLFAPPLSSFNSSCQRSPRRYESHTNFKGPTLTRNCPWEDECVVAARIPRENVVVVHLLSRGGFGLVYSGRYNGRPVAVKMLVPETRYHIAHVTAFLAEVKMMASMEHAHIVTFIGVAWDSLTNLCIVSEFMAGGDLNALLQGYNDRQYPMGFTREKVTIALHVAHALTYMHSFDPPLLHRDLKSKNVVLTEHKEAKLTDFGTSRERVHDCMTGGVGTSFWMAPEVMIGDRYDDKADMFSFGVVLSELDTHLTPYWQAKDPTDSRRKMSEPAILQAIVSGKLHVAFSNDSEKEMVELGSACVSLDATARPTASEALYKLHILLARDDRLDDWRERKESQ